MKSISSKMLFGLSAVLFLSLSACENPLQEDPKFLTPSNFFNSEQEALSALSGVYDNLSGGESDAAPEWDVAGYSLYLPLVIDGPTETLESGFKPAFDKHAWNSSDGDLMAVWRSLYTGVNRANFVVGRVGAMPAFANQNRILAEARFLRALFYFHLVHLWDNIPLLDKEITSLKGLKEFTNQNTKAAVYALMEADLQFAEMHLKVSYTGPDAGRATQGAASTLMLKTMAMQGRWADAAAKAGGIITSNRYKLYDQYADVFSREKENEVGGERIFEVQYSYNGVNIGEGQAWSFWSTPWGSMDSDQGGWASLHVADAFYTSFPAGPRKNATFVDTVEYTWGETMSLAPSNPDRWANVGYEKYLEMDTKVAPNGNKNFVVFRYADVLLMQSEALNETSGPSAATVAGINLVRRRAALPPLDPSKFTKETLRMAIMDEMSWELCLEGHLLYVYKRHKDNGNPLRRKRVELLKAPWVGDFVYTYPIPQAERDLNPNLKQNTGY